MAAAQQTIQQELQHHLQQTVEGEIRFGDLDRWQYSTDASSYQVLPIGVTLPKHTADVAQIIKTAAQFDVSLVPRGGGTSLSGGSIGAGLVMDHSPYMNHILEINAAAHWASVQPGVTLGQLNRAAAAHGLMFGPDPASGIVATLGGMTANNSTGAHSIVYGMTADHVKAVTVVLSDGSTACFEPKTPAEIETLSAQDTLEGRIYRDLLALIRTYQADIAAHYPKTWRNVAGYNLHRLAAMLNSGASINLAPIIVGSEGTLGVITEIKVNLVPRPAYTHLALVQFDALRTALESVPMILEYQPAAIELIDRFFINLTRRSPEYGSKLDFVDGDPAALFVVEFAGDDPAALRDQARKMGAALQQASRSTSISHRETPADINHVWNVRKAGFGLLMSQRGDAKPLAFVDDAAVPLEHLADYAADVLKICQDYETEASFFAHASAGCLHINPVIDLKTQRGIDQMRGISMGVAERAIHYHGTTTGEHGEGYARSTYNQQLYGERLHTAFKQVKGLFDPENRFNPGKIIDAPEPWDPSILRFNTAYQTPHAPNVTFLDFESDGGFGGLVEMCNGQGICRKGDIGVMCPTYTATRDERYSTRGYANTLRAAMTGQLGAEGLLRDDVYDALSVCLGCKGCQRECPSLVDMAKLKMEYLAQVQKVKGVSLRNRLFGSIAGLNELAAIFPQLANWSFRNPLLRRALQDIAGIDQRRELPAIAPLTFSDWFRWHEPNTTGGRGDIILWDDTFLNYNDPQIGIAAVKILEVAGYQVRLIENRRCCGRPQMSSGMLDAARENAAHNIAQLYPYAVDGVPIVGLEPSCVSAFRDEYPSLIPADEARIVAEQVYFFDAFIAHIADDLSLPFKSTGKPATIYVHRHCHQKALGEADAMLTMLKLIPDARIHFIDSGCCGMAGSFGYETEHYDLSLAIGEDRLFPTVRNIPGDAVIVAGGMSCRQQIEHGTGRSVQHPVVYLAQQLAQ